MRTHHEFTILLTISALFASAALGWQGLRAAHAPVALFQQDPSLVATATALAESLALGATMEAIDPQSSPCTGARSRQELSHNLDAIDAALAHLSGLGNRFLDNRYHVDRARFMEEIVGRDLSRQQPPLGDGFLSGQVPTYGEAPLSGQVPTYIDCTALLRVTAQLAAGHGAALQRSIEWRERAPRQRQAEFGPALARVVGRDFAKPNPWRALSGCVRIGTAYWPQAHGDTLCTGSGAERAAEPGAIPPEADELRAALSHWTAKADGNTVQVLGRPVPQGGHVALTLRASAQSAAQSVARCYTGDAAACRTSGVNPALWQDRYEGAAARSVGIVQVDLASGAVEVLSSGMSPCYRQDHDGPGHDAGCPALPAEPAYHPDKLANRALHGEAMFGSLVKPVLALGLLRSDLGPYLRGAGRREFLKNIQHSDSDRFMDRLFGKDRGWEEGKRCRGGLVGTSPVAQTKRGSELVPTKKTRPAPNVGTSPDLSRRSRNQTG